MRRIAALVATVVTSAMVRSTAWRTRVALTSALLLSSTCPPGSKVNVPTAGTWKTGAPLADLPVRSDAERQQVLVDWNATARDYAHDRCIHDRNFHHSAALHQRGTAARMAPEAQDQVIQSKAQIQGRLNGNHQAIH